MEFTPIETLAELSKEDIQFIAAATQVALHLMKLGESPCKIKTVLRDIQMVTTGVSQVKAVPDSGSICCSHCVLYKDNPSEYFACLLNCEIGC